MLAIDVDANGSDNRPGEIVRGVVPLIGFKRLVVRAHGRSSARAVGNAVRVAAKVVGDQCPEVIAAGLSRAAQ